MIKNQWTVMIIDRIVLSLDECCKPRALILVQLWKSIMQVRNKYRIISGFVITKLKLIEAPLTLIPKSIDFSSTKFPLSERDPLTSFVFEASRVGQTS